MTEKECNVLFYWMYMSVLFIIIPVPGTFLRKFFSSELTFNTEENKANRKREKARPFCFIVSVSSGENLNVRCTGQLCAT